MWKNGEIEYNKATYTYQMKQFEVGSKYGINGGRISKLEICRKIDGKEEIVYQYCRELVIPPIDEDVSTVLQYIIDKYNKES